MKAAVLALGIALWAPYQCATKPNDRPMEDTAPQALWDLSERFKEENNPQARETTLRQIVNQYPKSRFAERARDELGIASPEGSDQPSQEEGDTGDLKD